MFAAVSSGELEHFHDFVAEVVDDLDGDAAGLGLGEGAGGVAVEGVPGFLSGVTCHALGFGIARHASTTCRSRLMVAVSSYCWSAVEGASSSSGSACCFFRFFGFGIGE